MFRNQQNRKYQPKPKRPSRVPRTMSPFMDGLAKGHHGVGQAAGQLGGPHQRGHHGNGPPPDYPLFM